MEDEYAEMFDEESGEFEENSDDMEKYKALLNAEAGNNKRKKH
jgi:hypothetical protein